MQIGLWSRYQRRVETPVIKGGKRILMSCGGGMAGSGLALAGGLGVPVNAFVPDLPVNVMVGVNANILTAIDDNIDGNTGYVSGFLMVGTSF